MENLKDNNMKPIGIKSYLPKKRFYLDDKIDKKIIEAFEQDLQKYQNQKENYFGHIITGFDLLCVRNGLIRYSKEYPNGAIVKAKLENYQLTLAKYAAYGQLLDSRILAAEEEDQRLQSLTL